MKINKAYKLKLRPTASQEKRLLEVSDATRFVWNYYLAQKRDIYMMGGKSPNYYDCAKDLTHLKKVAGMEWLSDEGHSQAMQQTLQDQEQAYKRFFKKIARFPRFKTKRDARRSFRLPNCWKLKGNRLQIMKDCRVAFGGTLPPMKAKLCSLTVSRDSVGTWWASVLTEQEIKPKKKTGKPIGIDVGLNHLIVTSNGLKIENIHPRKQAQQHLATLQRLLSRTKLQSKRRTRIRSRVARLHRKIGFKRSNYIHHVTRRIADENQAVIYAEDLAVKNMQRNHCLASSIADASWSECIRQLEYKQRWSGGELIKIDRYFPSSKMCSNCHHVLDRLPLSVRSWSCPRCHSKHDRDVNAARNILNQGAGCQLRVEKITDGSSKRKPRARVPTSMKR